MKYADILDEIDAMLDLDENELDDETKERLNKYLDQLAIQEQEKIDDFCRYVRSVERDQAAVEEEVKYFQAKKKKLEKKVANLKGYYLQIMVRHNLKKVKGLAYTISTRNSQSVDFNGDLDKLDDAYKRVKTTVEVDKMALKEALSSGKTVEGARIVTRTSLQIK